MRNFPLTCCHIAQGVYKKINNFYRASRKSDQRVGKLKLYNMAITGSWTLFYDWNCDGSYSKTTMTVNAGGTWTSGEGYSGLWVQSAGMFLFTYNNSETTYAGNLASKSITGISTTFGGLNGCFYMLQSGVPTAFQAERIAGKNDSSGKK